MPAANRRHVENLSGEQLYSVVFAKDTTLGHLVELANGKEMLLDFSAHDVLTCRRSSHIQNVPRRRETRRNLL
jgi:hypothetical protein